MKPVIFDMQLDVNMQHAATLRLICTFQANEAGKHGLCLAKRCVLITSTTQESV